MSNLLAGFLAASIAPLMMVIGFFIWGKSWKDSFYSLNVFKCNLAALLFMFMTFFSQYGKSSPLQQSMILLSSFIGIIIGDNAWLYSLKKIGPKRVIIIDSLKPFLAAILGSLYLQEVFSLKILLGIFVSTFGILLASWEKNYQEDDQTEVIKKNDSNKLFFGYLLALLNVVLDAFGFLITKMNGAQMTTWEINFIRFGFAAIFLSANANLYYFFRSFIVNFESDYRHVATSGMKEFTSQNITDTWYIFPKYNKMTPNEWLLVSIGIFFVTFLCPSMSNYALFQLPMGLCLTLNSLGPIYSIPIAYIMNHEVTDTWGIFGSVLAFLGIVILCS